MMYSQGFKHLWEGQLLRSSIAIIVLLFVNSNSFKARTRSIKREFSVSFLVLLG